MEIRILLCSDNLLLVLLQKNFWDGGWAQNANFVFPGICMQQLIYLLTFFWLPAAAFSAQPQSISPAFTQFSHLSKIWTDLRAHLLYSSFASGTFLLNFQLFSIAKPCLVTRQLSSQVGRGLKNALRQKSSKFANLSPVYFYHSKVDSSLDSASYFCQVPLSLHCACVIQWSSKDLG